ncbi:MAG: choice-of-anchor J domain-containing protein, partial [Bacteroidales bacterium]|nr:choice-of-anchor J domain-containing protein [Bacteroidales bacterium]
MKKVNSTLFLFLIGLMLWLPNKGHTQTSHSSLAVQAVDSIVIGTGTETSMNTPVTAWYGYSFTQTLYLQDEINISNKVISQIGYQYAGSDSDLELELEVWMSHTELSSLTQTVSLAEHIKVYDGPWHLHAGEEYSTIETYPFYYNNSSNLLITVIEKKPGYNSSTDRFYVTPIESNEQMCVGDWNDSSPYEASNLPAGSSLNVRSNIKIWFDEMPTGPAVSVITPGHLDFGDVEIGGTEQQTLILKNAGVDMLEITGFQTSNAMFQIDEQVSFPIQLGMLESKAIQVNFTPTNSTLQSGTLTFLFDAGIEGDRTVSVNGRGVNLVAVVVGDGEEANSLIPISPYYGYSFSQTIYLQSEIDIQDRMIQRIGYHYAGSSTDLNLTLEIYLSHTELTELTGIQQLSGHSKVFDGPVVFSQNTDFTWIPLEGFYYNNTDNLIVTVIEKRPGYNSPSDQFYATSIDGGIFRSRYARNDSNPYDPQNLPNGNPEGSIPNTKFWLGDIPTEPIISINPDNLDYGQVEATVEKTLTVIAKNKGGGILTIEGIDFSNDVFSVKDTEFPVNLAIGESHTFQISFIPDEIQLEEGTATFIVDESVPGNKVVQLSGRGLRFGVLREGFEDELFPPFGWKVVDNNGDSKGWLRNTNTVPTGQVAPRTGVAAAGLDTYAGSPGQNSYDDWLITPQMIWQDGDLFSFWIKRLANQTGQRWRIAYSTSGSDPSEFTVIDEIVDPSMNYTEMAYDMNDYGLIDGELYYMAFQFYSNWCWPGVIDDVMGSVVNRFQNDLLVNDFSTQNEYLNLDTPSDFIVEIGNYGLAQVNGSDYKVQLASYINGNETILAEVDGVDIIVGEMIALTIPLIMEQTGEFSIYAKIDWPDDMNEVNNVSDLIDIEVLGTTKIVKHIGSYPIPDNASYSNYYPIDFEDSWRSTSLTQTIYHANELNTGGIIDRIMYYRSFGENMSQRKIKIWVQETKATDVEEYTPPSQMKLVFDGKVDFNEGIGKVMLPLTYPFVYSGGTNLLVTVFYYEGSTYANHARFAYNWQSGASRTIRDDGFYEINPEQISYPYSTTDYPITSFIFEIGEGLGNINGRVLYEADNSPVEDAEIQIIHPDFPDLIAKVYSNAQGYYSIPYALAGQNLQVIVSKYGYSDVIYNDVELAAGGNINLGNALMKERPQIALSGSVIKSTTLTAAESAHVILSGIDTYETYTAADGSFGFDEIWGETTYTISIHLEGFQNYTAEITVPDVNYQLPQITLSENAPAPNVVTATSSGSDALVTWFAAGQPYPQTFRYDDGVAVGVLITPGSPTIVGGSAWKHHAFLQNVQWYTYNSANYQKSDEVMVTILGLNPDGSPNPDDVLYIKEHLTNDYGWNDHKLTEMIETPNGFFFGISGYNNYTLLAYDDGEGEPWEWQPRTQWSNGLGSYNPLENATSPPLHGSIFIRAAGLTYGPIELSAPELFFVQVDKADSQLITESIPTLETVDPEIQIKPMTAIAPKAFESYNIFRKKSTESEWTQLNTQPITDTSFLDTGFSPLTYGAYQFGVEAVYTNDVLSDRALSNMLEKDMRLALTLEVETNTGVAGISEGASVKLVNNNGNVNYIYNAIVGEDGSVTVNNIFKGVYTLTVTKAGFYPYTETSLDLEIEGITYQFSVSITEKLDDPYDVEVLTEGMTIGKARLLWNQEPIFDDLESYTAFAISDVGTWKFVDQDGNPTVYPSGVSYPNMGEPMAYIVMNRAQTTPPLNEAYWNAHSGNQYFAGFASATGNTNNWLISELQQHSRDYTLSFWAKTVFETYGLETFRIGYSTASDNLSDFVFITGNVTTQSYWQKYTYQIPDEAKYVTIRHNYTGAALLIDDISIGVESDGAIPGNGFTVYLDGEEIANGLTTTQYDYTNLLPGSYTAGVKAVYHTGESNIIEIPFELPPGTPVTLEVKDNTGQLMDMAFVEISQQGILLTDGFTQNGIYEAELYPGTYQYEVSFDGYTTATGNFLVSNSPLTVNITLTSIVELSFEIKNNAGQAVENATVVVNNQYQQTPANGIVSFDIEPGLVSWAITHPQYERALGSQQITQNTNLQIILDDLQCEAPQNLQANVNQNNVTLNWDAPVIGANGSWLHWDGEHGNNSIGTGGVVDFDVAQRFTPADLSEHDGKFLTRVVFVPREESCTYSVRVWTGGNISGPENMLVDQVVTNPILSQWNEIFLDIPILIDASQELWIGFRNNTTTGHPAGVDSGPAIDGKGNMINLAGQGWQTLLEVAPTLNYNWSVRGLVESVETTGTTALVPLNDQINRQAPEAEFTLVHHTDKGLAGEPRTLLGYNIYRDDVKINSTHITALTYNDNIVAVGTHSYYVTSVWNNGCESAGSNIVEVTIAAQPASISLSPSSLSETLEPGQTSVQQLTVTNTGGSDLSFEIEVNIQDGANVLSPVSDPVNSDHQPSIHADAFAKAGIRQAVASPNRATLDEVIRYDNGINDDAIGLTNGGTFEVAAYWPASAMAQYVNMQLEKVEVYINDAPSSAVIKIYGQGTSSSPGALLYSQSFSSTPDTWITVELDTPVGITGSDIWIGYEVTHAAGQFPAGCDAGPAVVGYGDMIALGGAWDPISVIAGFDVNWNIAGYLVEDSGPVGEWLSASPLSGTISSGQSLTIDVSFD